MANFNNELINQNILDKYKTNLDADFIKKLSIASEINQQYQLNPDVAEDFNHAAHFLAEAVTKNSKLISEDATYLSSLMSDFLLKYFNTKVTKEETTELLSNIYNYNEEIKQKYNIYNNDKINDNSEPIEINEYLWHNLESTLNSIYGIDEKNLNIKSESMANKIYNQAKELIKNDSNFTMNNNIDLKNNFLLLLTNIILIKNIFSITNPNIKNLDINNINNHQELLKLNLFPVANNIHDELNKKNYYVASNYYITENTNVQNYIIDVQRKDERQYQYKIQKHALIVKMNNNISSTNNNDYFWQFSIGTCSDLFYKFTSSNNIIPSLKLSKIKIGNWIKDDKGTNITDDRGNNILNVWREFNINNIFLKNILTKEKEDINNLNQNAYYIDTAKILNIINSVNSEEKYLDNPISGYNETESIQIEFENKDIYSFDINYLTTTLNTNLLTFIALFNKKLSGAQNDYVYLNYLNKVKLNNISEILLEYNIMMRTFLIYTEFLKVQNISSGESINNIKKIEKNSSNELETYRVYEFLNVIPIKLTFLINKDDPLYHIILKFNPELIQNDTDLLINIGIIYKEFNQYVRTIDLSDIQNRIIGEYLSSNLATIDSYPTDTLLNNALYDAILSHTFALDFNKEIIDLFHQTYTNDFIIYNSVVNDIIRYVKGNLINFGEYSIDNQDIESILNIYKECRDYFYKVLYNKSFIFDDKYNIYIILIIKAQTLERFMSSRIDNFLNINKFTVKDCRNFLISYGLKTLSDQIDKKNFLNSIDYKRRIIANYNEIMSKKGSRSVIDECFKIFNYDSSEIEIYKYIIFQSINSDLLQVNTQESKENTELLKTKSKAIASPRTNMKLAPTIVSDNEISKGTVHFVSSPYYSKSIYYDISNAEEKNLSENYNSFIQYDKYWKKEELSEKDVSNIITSPVNTKYLGLDLKKDLYNSLISSKYVLSLNDYLYKNLFLKNTNNSKYDSIYSSKDFRFVSDEVLGTSNEFDILFLYNAERLLFALYIYYYEMYLYHKKPFLFNNSLNNKYFGINENATLIDLKENSSQVDSTYEYINNLFTTYAATFDEKKGQYIIDVSKPIPYYLYGKKIKPFDIPEKFKNSPIYINLGTSVQIPDELTSLFPIDSGSFRLYQQGQKDKSINMNYDKYNQLHIGSKELHFNKTEDNDQFSSLTSEPLLNEAFNSISLINLFNKLNKESAGRNEKSKYMKMIYYFNKFQANDQGYTSNGADYDLEQTESGTNLKNFYENLYNNAMIFPLKYLLGDYVGNANLCFTKKDREIVDKIFNTFFITDTPIFPIFKLSTKTNIMKTASLSLGSKNSISKDGITVTKKENSNNVVNITLPLTWNEKNTQIQLKIIGADKHEIKSLILAKDSITTDNIFIFNIDILNSENTLTFNLLSTTVLENANLENSPEYVENINKIKEMINLMYASYYDDLNPKEDFIKSMNFLFKDILIISNDNADSFNIKLKINTENDFSINKINEIMMSLSEILNMIVEGFINLKLELETSTSIGNFFEFIITTVSFFISYTSLLYKTNLIMSVDTRSEKVPLTYNIDETLWNKFTEYFYNDEEITIKEIK